MAEKQIWSGDRRRLYLQYESPQQEELENVIYTVGVDQFGRPFLEFMEEKYEFDYKLYGLESKLINRIVKSFASTNGNMGILFNGLKGTGKSVTAKQVCNKMQMPVILLNSPDLIGWVNEIPQQIVVFIDEYEKTFKDGDQILTVMDGALESVHRRVFLLTTNKLYINENLIHRPGRIRYLKTFKDLSPEIVAEIVDDLLAFPELRDQVISFCSSLESITIDVVKSVCQEVNIHCEPPQAFEDVFNVRKITGKFDISLVIGEKEFDLFNSVKIWPREINEEHVNEYTLQISDSYIGTITELIDYNTFKVTVEGTPANVFENLLVRRVLESGIDFQQFVVEKKSPSKATRESIYGSLGLKLTEETFENHAEESDVHMAVALAAALGKKTGEKSLRKKSKAQKESEKSPEPTIAAEFTLRQRHAFMTNYSYRYGKNENAYAF